MMNSWRNFFSASIATVAAAACVPEQATVGDSGGSTIVGASADDLLVVDCLLPGRVQKLGSQLTYLSARRPISTTAQDCEIRGGEYTAYDRANYASALQVWLPLAQAGDPNAQNKVGEIYERGIGGAPDYELAALWYRRSADQGFPRAQINLGFLYERGLGVTEDRKAALNLYREASDLPDAVLLDSAEAQAASLQLQQLQRDLARTQQQLESARRELRQRARDLENENRRLRKELDRQGQGASSGAAVDEQRALERQKALIQRLEAEARVQQEQLALLQSEGASVKGQLAAVRAELRHSQEELRRNRVALAENERELEAARARSREEQLGVSPTDDAIREVEQVMQRRDQEQQAIADIQSETLDLQQRLADLGAPAQDSPELRTQISAARSDIARAQKDLTRYQEQVSAEVQKLKQTTARLSAVAEREKTGETERVRTLQKLLRQRQEELEAQRQLAVRLETQSADWEQQLYRLEQSSRTEKAALEGQLNGLQADLAKTREQLEQARRAAETRADELESAYARLLQQSEAQEAQSSNRAAELEATLSAREDELESQRAAIEKLEEKSGRLLARLETLEKTAGNSGAAGRTTQSDLPLAPPSIQLIEPPLVAVRGGDAKIPVSAKLSRRTIIGQVSAGAELYALTVNGESVGADGKGLFKTEVPLTTAETPINIVAIDVAGRRGTLAFQFVSGISEEKPIAKRLSFLQKSDVGEYYALVIGNQDYATLPDLDTSVNDARDVATILQEKYGFKTTLLLNADRYQILSELNKLRKKLTENDNLLIYYAGHGELDRTNMRGHWLPVDAERHSTANWISNVAVTDILNAMSVRHVLVVVDSCYSGALTRSSLANLESGQTQEERAHWFKLIAKMRSRTVLSSGGLQPVLDGGGGEHSVFAKALLGVLSDMEEVVEGQRLYREVAARVAFEANKYQVEQVPEYAPIKYAGHESGDFLLIPKTLID